MRIIVAITGATGAVYGISLLRALTGAGVETHLIYSEWGRATIEMETSYRLADIEAIADRVYRADDLAAPVASGSFSHAGMVIAPCSMKTLSAVANGYTENLISRAADVTLKEKRRLIMLTRETPLHEIHLTNMLRLARAGAVIMPPVPAFYHHPATITDLVMHTVSRVLDLLQIENDLAPRWEGPRG